MESVEAPLKVLLFILNYYQKQKDVQNRCHSMHAAKLTAFWKISSVIFCGLNLIDYTKIVDFINNIVTPLFVSRYKRRMRLNKAFPTLHPWLPNSFRGAPWVLWCSVWNTMKIWFFYAIIRNCGHYFWSRLRVCHMWSRSDGWLLRNRLWEDIALRKLCPLTLFFCEVGRDSHCSVCRGTLRSMSRNAAYSL
jgi:hypothetical protein